jgi:hypothetical protein
MGPPFYKHPATYWGFLAGVLFCLLLGYLGCT